MLDDQRPGTIYWIDHYVIPTDDIDRWEDFHTKVLGAHSQPTSEDRRRQTGVFQDLASPCHHGGFVQRAPIPASAGLGKGLPRHGLFIRPEDIDDHPHGKAAFFRNKKIAHLACHFCETIVAILMGSVDFQRSIFGMALALQTYSLRG